MTNQLATDSKNVLGFKDCCNIYRTVSGLRWGQYSDYPEPNRVSAYRAAGLRCRKVTMGDGYAALVMHPDDWTRAGDIDAALAAPEEGRES